MPFVPLTPEEQKPFAPPCTSSEHYPPTMMVITAPMKWRCPACGAESMVIPSTARCENIRELSQ